jgi:hypothetical protein
VLDVGAARPELGGFGGDFVHAPGSLGRVVDGAGSAAG